MVLVMIEALGTFDLGERRLHMPPGPQFVLYGDGPGRTIIKSRLQDGPIVWLDDRVTMENLSVVGSAEKQFQFPIGDGGVTARYVTLQKIRTLGPTDGLYFTGPQSTVLCEDATIESKWDTVFLRDGSKALLRRCGLRSFEPNAIHPHQHGLAQSLSGSMLRLEDCTALMRGENSDSERKLTDIRIDEGGEAVLVGVELTAEVPDWLSRNDLLVEGGQAVVSRSNICREHCPGTIEWLY